MSKKYDFETWKEVQDNQVEHWYNELFSELKNVANVYDFIENWSHVKEMVVDNTSDCNVKEEFTYNNESWLEEIYVQIKPYFKEWLDRLLKDDDLDYTDYVNNFWNE